MSADDFQGQWYARWFDKDYIDLYQYRDEEEAARFLGCLLRCAPMLKSLTPILDLACGSGRHLKTIHYNYGWDVYGIDLSEVMLDEARRMMREEGHDDLAHRLIRGDMRSLPFADSSFGLVFSAFTSFGYFERDEDHLRTLKEVARILKPGGGFVLDLINPEVTVSHLIPENRIEQGDMVAVQQRYYDAETRRIHKNIRLTRIGGESREITEIVRVFDRDEIVELLADAGFTTERLIGDYLGGDFELDRSERMILMNRKTP